MHGGTGAGGTPVLHPANAKLQNQQLFVNEPPPGRKGLFLTGGAVDGPDGLRLGEQAVLLQHFRRERVGQELRVGEELADAFGNDPAGKPLRLGVNGLKGDALHLCIGAHLRVDHLAAEHPACDDALKIILPPEFQLLGGVGVVEPGDLQTGNIVPGGDPLHPPPTWQDAPAGLGEYLRLDDTLGVQRGGGNGVRLGKIQIPARIVAEQIGQGHDAQFFKPLGRFGPDALEVAHRGIRGKGGVSLGSHGATSFRLHLL